MPVDLFYIMSVIHCMMSNRWLLDWRTDHGGAGDAIAAGLRLVKGPFSPEEFQAAVCKLGQGLQTAEKVAAALKEATAGGLVNVGVWSPKKQRDGHAVRFRLLCLGADKWVLLLCHGRNGVLVLDPMIGVVHYPMKELRKFDRIPYVASWSLRLFDGSGNRAKFRPNWTRLPEILTGFCVRILLSMLLIMVCVLLFFLQESATSYSIELLIGLICAAGTVLLVARWSSYRMSIDSSEEKKGEMLLKTMKAVALGKDLLGFRGRQEHVIVQRGYERVNQHDLMSRGFEMVLGSTLAAIMVSFFLSPFLPVLFLVLVGVGIVAYIADRIYVPLPFSRDLGGLRQHRRFTQKHTAYQAATIGKIATLTFKFGVIALAGTKFLDGALSDISLTYWILAAMVLFPGDVMATETVVKGLMIDEPVEKSTTQLWVKPRLLTITPAPLKISAENGLLFVDGLNPQMSLLSQADLTSIEQRHVVCQVIEQAFSVLNSAGYLKGKSPVFLGLCPPVNEMELSMMKLHEALKPTSGEFKSSNPTASSFDPNLEVMKQADGAKTGTALSSQTSGFVSCLPEEFPVVLDISQEISSTTLQQVAQNAKISGVAVLNMKRMSIYQASLA